MEKLIKSLLTIPAVAVATLLLLMVPLVAMQFTNEVNWSAGDFILMGALLFGTGSILVLVLRQSDNMVFRTGVTVAIGTTFLMIWANLAVGLIGSGPNPGNLMYAAVIAVLFVGIYLSQFKAAGLERAMYATALALVAHTVIALVAGMQYYPGSSVWEIVGVNLFFMAPFAVAGLLFRFVALQQASDKSK